MTRRYETLDVDRPAPTRLRLGAALRDALAAGYGGGDLRADVLAGLVVGVVALPLSMALAIAVGVAPQHGLYTAAVAGAVAALTGGSRFQVTGPTAAFVVVLTPIVEDHGLDGLLLAGVLAGLMLIGFGLVRLGRLIEFIPHPVTTGFTAGIATVIAILQLENALGLSIEHMPAHFPDRVAALWAARGTLSLAECAVAAATIVMLVVLPRLTRRVPAPLLAIGIATIAVAVAEAVVPGFSVATIGSRFSTTIDGRTIAGIPDVLPRFTPPWAADTFSFATVRDLLPSAFAIAMLGAIESLLSAVIADGMTGTRHDPDAELLGLGLANLAVPFFGGIAATGALARTATNVRAGARSPIASIVHALVILGSILLLAPALAHVPMAALAALLIVVAFHMSEARHFAHIVRVAPKSDVSVLLACYVLTVVVDMVAAVTVGVVLAAILFMSRMAELTHSRLLQPVPTAEPPAPDVPRGVAVYEIAGALFFGAAQRAMNALGSIHADVKVVVLALGRVPVIDATGLVALESALEKLAHQHRFVIIAGPLPEPRKIFQKAELEANLDHVLFAKTFVEGLEIARDLIALNPDWNAPLPGAHAAA